LAVTIAGMGTAAAATKKKPTSVAKLLKRRAPKVDAIHLPDAHPAWPEIITVEQAADYLQRHKLTLYREIQDGTIPNWVYVRFGPRTIRIFKSQLDKYMAAKSTGAR
jgi:excisionase family DNA binding protein